MVDPTWTQTCPCGAKVSVNMMGQHHHTDCEHDPLHPGCCEDPSLSRRFYWTPDAGVECGNCGEVWRGDRDAYIDALADRMTTPGRFLNGPPRGLICTYHRRLLRRHGD